MRTDTLVALAVDDVDTRAYVVPPIAGVAAAAVAAVAFAIVVWLWRRTAPSSIAAAPAGIDLRPETPAVVDLLTGGFTVEDDAVPATVVDLAARGWYTIEDQGPQVVIRTRTVRPSSDTLNPYEQRVLSHIERHASSGVVPMPVLTLGPKGVSKRWVKAFRREVVADAQSQGLCTNRWTVLHMAVAWSLDIVILLAVWLAAQTADPSDDVYRWFSIGNILVAVAATIGMLAALAAVKVVSLHAQSDTPAGATAAAHWLGVRTFYRATGQFDAKPASSVAVWDRHLAYATALGLASRVEREIPFETEHDRHAWSKETGEWRRINVRYRSIVPGRGRHPLLALLAGLITLGVAGALAWVGLWLAMVEDPLEIVRDEVDPATPILTTEQGTWVALAGIAIAALGALLATYGTAQLLGGLIDVFRRREREGALVRRREFGGGEDSTPTYYLAVDDGTRDDLLAFEVRSSIYSLARQGARVRVRHSPWLGYVTSLVVITPAPDDGEAPSLGQVDAALADATARFTAALVGRFAPHMTPAERAAIGLPTDGSPLPPPTAPAPPGSPSA